MRKLFDTCHMCRGSGFIYNSQDDLHPAHGCNWCNWKGRVPFIVTVAYVAEINPNKRKIINLRMNSLMRRHYAL